MNEDRFDLARLWEVLKKQRKVIWGFLCAALVIALLINLILPSEYESTVNLRVSYPRAMDDKSGNLPSQDLMKQEIATYAEIVKSRSVINTAIDRLYEGKENKPTYEDMIKKITTQPGRNSGMLSFSALAGSPEDAQKIANTILAVYNEKLVEIARAPGKETRVFIGERLVEAKNYLDKAENAMVGYKKDKQTVSVSDQTRNLIERQAELSKMQVSAEMLLETAYARQSSVNSQLAQISPGFIGDSPLIQQYKSRLADQQAELVGMKQHYTDLHPKVKNLQATIDETRAKLDAEITRVVNSEAPSSNPVHQSLMQSKIQSAIDIALGQAQQSALKRVGADFEKELQMLPEKEQGLARLMRDYTVAEETYSTLAKRYEQARIDEVMQPTNVQLVDSASLPVKPVKPNKALNLIIAAFAGLFAGLLAAFAKEYFYETIDTIVDVKRHLGTTVIGCIPKPEIIIK